MGAPRRLRSRLISVPVVFTRRAVLRRLAALGAAATLAPALSSCGDSGGIAAAGGGGSSSGGSSSGGVSLSPFRHGIATGDPTSTAMIFWTRTTPDATENIPVTLRVYQEASLQTLVATTTTVATAARDWTVKIDQTGLQPATTYYYQFEAKGFLSAVGRTRTAPNNTSRLRFGLVSCSSYAHGFFNAYAFLRQRLELDAIVHLGDYIYEYASDANSGDEVYGTARPYEPTHEMKTLADYRTRHAYYKRTDPDLIELHRQFPFITIWDDHESTDNAWRDGASNHQPNDGNWPDRKVFSRQAYDEWMPIRLPVAGDNSRIFRVIRYGNLMDLVLTDSRLFDRDVQLSTPIQPQEPRNAADRKLFGPVQRQFLLDSLTNSTAQWRMIGNQVVFHQWSFQPGLKAQGGPLGLNGDAWDAYTAERQLIIDAFRTQNINNVVFLTGDVHSSWVADITDDPNNVFAYNPANGTGSVATEFVVTSVTSPAAEALEAVAAGANAFRSANPHIKYLELTRKGYSVLDVTPTAVTCEYWYVSTIAQRGGTETFATAFAVADGARKINGPVAMTTAPNSPAPAAP